MYASSVSTSNVTAPRAAEPIGPSIEEPAPETQQVIVVAIDDTDGAAGVVSAAARAARDAPSVLHVVHVLRASRFDRARVGVPATPDSVIDASRKRFDARLIAAREECCAPVIGHFAIGDPETEVSRLCAELRADLLVIGKHDRTGFERLLLGSVSEGLARKATCPVMIVRPNRRSSPARTRSATSRSVR